jgi:hypothetical protein
MPPSEPLIPNGEFRQSAYSFGRISEEAEYDGDSLDRRPVISVLISTEPDHGSVPIR